MKAGRCELCNLETATDSSFCLAHARAEKSLREGYDAWNIAYGTIKPATFFGRLMKLKETGDRVKELIRFYESNPGKWK